MAEAAAKRRPKTRARILDASRALFNERGPGSVTTAEIAQAVGINEGNLYYHFQRKEQLLEALFADFEHALNAAATAYAAGGDEPERFRSYLGGWFGTMWEWRFFYRDGAVVFRLAPGLRPRLKALSDEGQALTRHAVEAMRAAGLLRIEPDELDGLIINAWIVSTYWIDYLRSRRGIAEVTREHVAWGARQVSSLFVPYLTPQGRALAEAGPVEAGGLTPPASGSPSRQ
jgi:AcrR family transcriptional regulator